MQIDLKSNFGGGLGDQDQTQLQIKQQQPKTIDTAEPN